MSPDATILRRWCGLIRTEQSHDYVRYIVATGLDDYRRTPGNLGAQMLTRDLGDGTTEVTTLSWWSSFEAITAFTGADYQRARYYPDDDQYLLTKPERVEHHLIKATR